MFKLLSTLVYCQADGKAASASTGWPRGSIGATEQCHIFRFGKSAVQSHGEMSDDVK